MSPLLLTAWTVASAQSAPDRDAPPASGDDTPLALPVDQVHAPVPEVVEQPTSDQPLAIPGRRGERESAARVQALRQYQRERLDIGSELQFHVSSAPTTLGVGFGGPWRGMYWGMRVSNPYVHTTQNFSIYQGRTRLDVPDFLGTVGEPGLRASLDQDILRANRAATAWNAVTGIGVAGVVVGAVGMSGARSAYEYYSYANVATAGLVTTLSGALFSSITSSKSFKLRRYPSASIGVDQAERLADQYNDQLRQQLGLSADDVWTIESQDRQ